MEVVRGSASRPGGRGFEPRLDDHTEYFKNGTYTAFLSYALKNKRVQHLKGPRSDSVFIVLHLPYYPAGNSLKC